jgi:hypothetical protein
MGGDFSSRDPRFTGHFLGSFVAFHATSLMACAITLSLDQDRLAVSPRIPSTLTDRHMPRWVRIGYDTPRPASAIEQYPSIGIPRPFELGAGSKLLVVSHVSSIKLFDLRCLFLRCSTG